MSDLQEEHCDARKQNLTPFCTQETTDGNRSSRMYSNIPDFGSGFVTGSADGIPDHAQPRKQLYSRTGYFLAVFPAGTVYGTREEINKYSELEITAVGVGEVRIKGVATGLFICMSDIGRLHAKANPEDDDEAVFLEILEGSYNIYLNKKYRFRNWYLGIKKSGNPKPADMTARGQKAVQFLPRAFPRNN